MSDRHAIEVTGLSKRYRGARGQPDVEAVRGIDLDVARGGVFAFLGPNGAGKTTTVRVLRTLLPISGGEATVAGVDVRQARINPVTYVITESALFGDTDWGSLGACVLTIAVTGGGADLAVHAGVGHVR